MKRYAIAFGALILIGAMGAVASAQPITGDATGRFNHGYLDEHPEVARQLAHNPELVDNESWMANHPELRGYLSNHPEVRRELKHHPKAFMSDEWRHDVYPSPLATTDRYK